ncbi:MAG: hypothetical protein U0996_06015 [Planctomycetaceae bacterium]
MKNHPYSCWFTVGKFARRLAMLLLAVLGAGLPEASAQDTTVEIKPDEKKTDPQPDDLKAVQIEQQVKPAFLITPLVHRLQARKGQLLKFEFEIEAHDRPSKLEIRPVAMTQQENGVIMPDEQTPAPGLIRVTSDTTLDLTKSEKHTIQAEMRIPQSNAPFLSYGILAREIPNDDDGANGPDDEARVGIRFVTQYLLRVDVDVLGVKGDSVAELKLYDGGLVSQNGRCLARVFVENPTDTAMEFSVNSQLLREETQSVGKKFGLVVPVRSGQQGPDRYKARILPKTKLRLEEFLPHAVFSGNYTLRTELLHQNRVLRTTSFPAEIRDGDFPEQDARVVRVAQDITVSPTQLELSLRKGGRRIETLTVSNGSQQKVRIQLSPEALQGELNHSLQLRPAEFELERGQTRKVVVTVDTTRDTNEHSYANIILKASPSVGEALGTIRIPTALLTNSGSLGKLTPGQPEWTISNERAGFSIPVNNEGLMHIPLRGRLSLTDSFGRGFVVEAGYGRWLLPGQSDSLFFGFREPPPPGEYEVQVLLNQNEGLPPLQMRQNIRLQSPLEEVPKPEKVSERPAETKQ